MILHVFERWRWSSIQQMKSPHRCWVGKWFPKWLGNRFKKLFLVCFWNSTHRILFYSNTFYFVVIPLFFFWEFPFCSGSPFYSYRMDGTVGHETLRGITFQFSPQQSGEFLFVSHAFHDAHLQASSHSFDSGFRHQVVTPRGLKPCRRWRFIHFGSTVILGKWEFIQWILGKHQWRKSIAQTNKHQICFMRQLHVLRVKTSGSYEGIQWSRLLFYSECLVCFGDSCSESSLEHLTL